MTVYRPVPHAPPSPGSFAAAIRKVWQPGSCGTGKRHWHVWRKLDGQPQEQLLDKRGNYRWFGSYEAARRAADKANTDA